MGERQKLIIELVPPPPKKKKKKKKKTHKKVKKMQLDLDSPQKKKKIYIYIYIYKDATNLDIVYKKIIILNWFLWRWFIWAFYCKCYFFLFPSKIAYLTYFEMNSILHSQISLLFIAECYIMFCSILFLLIFLIICVKWILINWLTSRHFYRLILLQIISIKNDQNKHLPNIKKKKKLILHFIMQNTVYIYSLLYINFKIISLLLMGTIC